MAFRYSASVREAACRRMLAGERVEEVAGDLEMSAATLYRWKRQALVDVGHELRLSEQGGPSEFWLACGFAPRACRHVEGRLAGLLKYRRQHLGRMSRSQH
jgi:hypothetical protein